MDGTVLDSVFSRSTLDPNIGVRSHIAQTGNKGPRQFLQRTGCLRVRLANEGWNIGVRGGPHLSNPTIPRRSRWEQNKTSQFLDAILHWSTSWTTHNHVFRTVLRRQKKETANSEIRYVTTIKSERDPMIDMHPCVHTISFFFCFPSRLLLFYYLWFSYYFLLYWSVSLYFGTL